MENDRGVYWLVISEDIETEYDNAEAARKAATDIMTASLTDDVALFKVDPIHGLVELMV